MTNPDRSSRVRLRYDRLTAPSVRNWSAPEGREADQFPKNVVLECGWGRLIFGHTFRDPEKIAEALLDERPGRRDIALYIRDPQVVLAHAPQDLFLDPSHTYRLWFDRYRQATRARPGIVLRRLRTEEDACAVSRILKIHSMAPIDPEFQRNERISRKHTTLIAVAERDNGIVGVVMGVDHLKAFGDPENGSSLWCLAVDPQAEQLGIGEALVRRLAEHYQARGRAYMDLSVMHDNDQAIALYEKLGFERVPVFCLKKKNPINESLFIGDHRGLGQLNPYAKIIVDEALRRGIGVEIIDDGDGWFELSLGGRTVMCRESLTEMTSAVAMSRCDDKALTRRILKRNGLNVPIQREAGSKEENDRFLEENRSIVVKPARGEQGAGISIDVDTPEAVAAAVSFAREVCQTVLLESYHRGEDLRVIVIDNDVVAAATRRPPAITGDGMLPIRKLIEKKSRRREAATGGESRIPLDGETERAVIAAGYALEDVLPKDKRIVVRKTANLHTGGTIHDVTDHLNPVIAEAARRAAQALRIPVVGLDFMVPNLAGEDYVIIEANERPGLANHEPQPTAERFIDYLFPQTTHKQYRKSSA